MVATESILRKRLLCVRSKGGEKMQEITCEELARKMLEYRAKHNLTMMEMIDKAKVSYTTWLYVEKCQKKPSRLTIKKILNAIGEE